MCVFVLLLYLRICLSYVYYCLFSHSLPPPLHNKALYVFHIDIILLYQPGNGFNIHAFIDTSVVRELNGCCNKDPNLA